MPEVQDSPRRGRLTEHQRHRRRGQPGRQHGAKIVSNSYSSDEDASMAQTLKSYYTHPGVAQLAASGDYGFTTAQAPAVFANVVAVGGTSLTKGSTNWSESAWSGAGSGCSAYVAKPSWQKDTHCSMRTTSDVSALADPATGLAVYDTYGLRDQSGWIVVGGTSLATPLLAGMVGLAGNASVLSTPQYVYTHRAGFHDVVGGSSGYCGGDYLCTGLKGYDAPTGVGSPRGVSGL